MLDCSCVDLSEDELRQVRTLAGPSVDWKALIRLAEDHGTSSLLYRNLARAGGVPPAELELLRQSYERNVHKSLFLARELVRILDCLDAIGIEAIPYKGVVLSEVNYGDLAMRQAGDMDLFVRKQDVGCARDAVRELGYISRSPIPEDAEKDYIASGYECAFDSPAGKNLLELQWALQPRFYAVDFDMDGLFARARKVTVAGRSVNTPSAEDNLLILSVHAAKHVWARIIWLCDVAQLLKREKVNWDEVQAHARKFGIDRILHVTLLVANRFLATAIPSQLENKIVADRSANILADEIAARVEAGVFYEEQHPSYFLLMMRLRERPADRARFLSRLAFTPGPGEWKAVRLPRVLFPLYKVVRMARLAARFARG